MDERSIAERVLQHAIGQIILSDEDLGAWNSARNDGAEPQPEARTTPWEDWGGVLTRYLYVRSPYPDVVGELRQAWFYPTDGVLVIEDGKGNEVSVHNQRRIQP